MYRTGEALHLGEGRLEDPLLLLGVDVNLDVV